MELSAIDQMDPNNLVKSTWSCDASNSECSVCYVQMKLAYAKAFPLRTRPQAGHSHTGVVASSVPAAITGTAAAAADSRAAVISSTPPSSSSPDFTTGHTVLFYGGISLLGDELGSSEELQLLWLAPAGDWGVWLTVPARGEGPGPRVQHCAHALHKGSNVTVYGGMVAGSMAGTIGADVGEVKGYLLMFVYMLDVGSLTWSRHPTWPMNEPPKPGHEMVGPSSCPGPRRQVLSVVRVNPVSGAEELMILGGCGKDGLADFVPYSLDVENLM